MKKVLIFRAEGFVGCHLSQEFLNHNYNVYGTGKVFGKMLSHEVDFRISNLLDSKSVENIINQISPDIIINLSAISSVGKSWDIPQMTMQVNVIGTLNILEAVRKSEKNSKIMLIGSSEEYISSNFPMSEERPLNANNPYGISKITQEQFAKMYREQYGLKIYCVRSFNHTGVGQKETFVLPSFCKQVAEIEKSGKSGIMRVGNLAVRRDFSHVKDIVKAYLMIVESDDCRIVYNVGSGKTYSLRKLLEYVIGLSSQKIEIKVDLARFRPTDQPVICCDISLIKTQLGWEPHYTVFDALKEMFEEYVK